MEHGFEACIQGLGGGGWINKDRVERVKVMLISVNEGNSQAPLCQTLLPYPIMHLHEIL